MKLKNIAFIALGAALTLSSVSCSDSFLDEKMYSNYGTDVNDDNAKVLGLHYKFAQLWGVSNPQGFTGCWQDGTDVGSPGDIEGAEIPFYKYKQMTSEAKGVTVLWNDLYGIINEANIVINDKNVTPALKAEAEFFRAYSYELLVTLWGPVPLVTESTTTPRTDYTRTPVADVDKVIEADLTDAIANLPAVDKTVTEDRINKDAARMLAATSYLRMGMCDKSYYARAEKVITPTITEGNYKLISARYGKYTGEAGDFYHDMFRWGNQRRSQGNTEGVWTYENEYNRDVTGGTIDNPQQRRNWVCAFHKYKGMQNCDSLGGRGNGRLRLSNFVKYGLFEKGDIRNSNFNIRRVLWYNRPGYQETIGIDANGFRVEAGKGVRDITVKTGDQVVPREGDSLNVYYPYPTKWGGYDTTDDFGYALVKDWPIMRYAEAFLLRSEARMRQGKMEEAAADINVLRDRAFKEYREKTGDVNVGKVTASMMNIDFILDERARELISEENRRYTLVRTGTLAERWEKYHDQGAKVPESKLSTGFDPKVNILLPIPLTEIQLNKDAKIEQNPEYN
ncbi:RagB/SusD family nutrient uptake outer membrane protein [Segatella buccae]|uniref:RagB/SusD family nutrient uptake outer membrane protein n=1 Tax=Segatella buccae TaxID=28126 RepID=UPI0022DFE0FB|nr:RagB/SusD family nutrient uptake outer membrane protein [Segatella buccae]